MSRLSVVTICFRDLSGLKQTVDSLRAQTDYDFEHIIIDGGSEDGTREYLKSLDVPWKLLWVSEKDRGIYDAMNKGTERATHEFVWYLNSGDYAVDSGVIADIRKELERNRQVDLLYGRVYFEGEFGRRAVGRAVTAADFKKGMPASHPAMIFRRKCVLEHPYSLEYRIISDWILVRSFFENNLRTVFFDRVLTVFNTEGISSTQHLRDLKEKLRFEKTIGGKLAALSGPGLRYFLIWLSKKCGIYGALKRRQQLKA